MKDKDFSVEVKNLSKNFGNFTAVDNISFEVSKGEIFGFLGANGAGKTTTIRMLTGLLKPSNGTGHVAGFDINTQYEQLKGKIGYMSQKFSLYNDLTVMENFLFYGGIYGLNEKQIEIRMEELDEELEILSKRKNLTGSLPPGFKQRVALGCSILHNPHILFLDEPTGGVDPIARRYFWDLISLLASKGTTVFVTTHYMDEAEYCRRISIMNKGKISAIDSPQNLKNHFKLKSIEEIFIHLAGKND
ncbi:MAG: hypothetical protein ACD_79C00488G0004 [uncultured bacterium]|nr:MAG: hypothetical protein ACD_79C00488G0004 [uncultured bacterium]